MVLHRKHGCQSAHFSSAQSVAALFDSENDVVRMIGVNECCFSGTSGAASRQLSFPFDAFEGVHVACTQG